MTTFEFDGQTFEYDEDVLTDYEFFESVLMADDEPKQLIRCFRMLFAGRDREYARAIGGKMERMGELLKAAIEDAGEKAKN